MRKVNFGMMRKHTWCNVELIFWLPRILSQVQHS